MKTNIRAFVTRLAARNFYTYLWWKSLFLKLDLSKRPIFVYSPGKTASTTVCSSLKRVSPDRAVYHLHFLDPGHVTKAMEHFRIKYSREKLLPDNIIYSRNIVKAMRRGYDVSKVTVVTGVRDPIAAGLSEFFENRFSGKNVYPEEFFADETSMEGLTDEACKYIINKDRASEYLSWFDRELKSTMGVDVFSEPFDREKGFVFTANASGPDVLVYRVEDLNACFDNILVLLTGRVPEGRIDGNTAEGKPYSPVYKEILGRISFEDDLLDELYGNKYVRHFYSPEEIKKLRQKWQVNG